MKFLQNSRVRQSPLATRRAFLKKKGTGFLGSVERPRGWGWDWGRWKSKPETGADDIKDCSQLSTHVGGREDEVTVLSGMHISSFTMEQRHGRI